MASKIEEIVETDPPPRNDNFHNDNTTKNDNYIDINNGDINGNWVGVINDEKDEGIGEDKKKDARKKGTFTRVLCCPFRLATSWITTRKVKSSRKEESERRGNHSADPPEPEFDPRLPNFLSQNQFQNSPFFREFLAKFGALKSLEQKCLWSFIMFPVNTIVKKRELLFWWIGEGFLDNLKSFEDSATTILDKFRDKNFILPVNENFQKAANSFKIHPHVRSAMIALGLEAKSLGSTSDGDISSWYDNREYLINSKPLLPENLEKVKTLFNVSKETLDFNLESFSRMSKVEVLYLGRWQNSAEHQHIEVADTEFLKGFKNMEKLRSLSLQGISGIPELPSSISNLTSLRMLDLRACYSLEKLPKEINCLKKLTHLDISECYLLDYMPRELLSLSELQVLKGFVITDTKNRIFCSLADLAGLKKLRKLSVSLYSATFSIEEFSAVFKFKQLLKLKIIWGGKVSKVKRNKNSKQENGEANAKPKAMKVEKRRSFLRQESVVREATLEKLELQCLPHKTLPNWVNPDNLPRLKKLYIRGGGLKSLGRIQEENHKWEVETLRLKYLNDLNTKWIELMTLFPRLQYLEKFQCPRVIFFPCDCNGIWVKRSTQESPPLPQTTS